MSGMQQHMLPILIIQMLHLQFQTFGMQLLMEVHMTQQQAMLGIESNNISIHNRTVSFSSKIHMPSICRLGPLRSSWNNPPNQGGPPPSSYPPPPSSYPPPSSSYPPPSSSYPPPSSSYPPPSGGPSSGAASGVLSRLFGGGGGGGQ